MFLLYYCHPLSDLPRISQDPTSTQKQADVFIPTEELIGDLMYSLVQPYTVVLKWIFLCVF